MSTLEHNPFDTGTRREAGIGRKYLLAAIAAMMIGAAIAEKYGNVFSNATEQVDK